jgi:UDP-glucose 4-epimerase
MHEDYPYRPETIYGASKLAGEYYAGVFHRAGWIPTIVARPYNNYGPRAYYDGIKGEVIPRFVLLALTGRPLPVFGDGSQTRDFTFVSETADILIQMMESDACLGQTINVCRGEEVSVRELASAIIALTGSRSEIQAFPGRPADVLRQCGDPARLQRTLGRTPSLPLREGLRRTIDWYREAIVLDEKTLRTLTAQNWLGATREDWLSAPQDAG